MNAALFIIIATIAGALVLGLLARRGIRMDIEQWSVGGRSFGPVFMFVLMAGEVFTTFTFLGVAVTPMRMASPPCTWWPIPPWASCCRTGCCRPYGGSGVRTVC
ncbi:hypothetical protein RAA17_01855 [Komagataeibacter rhaeticus]|nr:hypothetical protein [Komagataeibacter rhaeticus]